MKKSKLYSARQGRQLSVFIENRPGTLGAVIDLLRENGINMLALSLSEGLEGGYLRIIVDDPVRAAAALRKSGNLVIERDVVLLAVANEPGGLASAIDVWAKAGINVEYAYSADDANAERSLIVARVPDPKKAIAALHL